MTAYAIARLYDVELGPWIVPYLSRIEDTMKPFGGRFLVHGGEKHVREGEWTGDTIVMSFPDTEHANAWYDSADYQQILALRTDHSKADIVIVPGVSETYCATEMLVKVLAA